jgi:hypothetical protein
LPRRKLAGFKTFLRNVVCNIRLVSIINRRENKMLKIAALTGALAVGLVSGAYAQTTGPAGQQDMNKPAMTNTNSNAMKKTGTSGMSSGGGSGMNDKGGANGAPNTMPKTTTGTTGPASSSESPAK